MDETEVGVHKFSKNLRAASKFWALEGCDEASSILNIQKYKTTPCKFCHHGVMAFGVFPLLDLGNKWDNIKNDF